MTAPLVVLAPPIAQAQTSSGAAVMIVLDVSGSMDEDVEPGKSRLDVAKEALTSAVAGIEPGSIDLGLRTFARCGSDLLVELGPADPASFNQQVDSISSGGKTGIETALRAAVQDLGQASGKRTIMLISDGAETCGGDPCAAAADLLATNIDFVVNTVGFQTAGTFAETQLQCIADATGGTLTPVEDLPELFDVIEDAIDPCSGLTLVECYAPEVRFHSREKFFPMDPADFIAGAELRFLHSGVTCNKDVTVTDVVDIARLGHGDYKRQQLKVTSSVSLWPSIDGRPRFNIGCNSVGKRYNTSEYTRPYSDSANNGERAADGTDTLDTREGFTLHWTDYAGDTPVGLRNNPGSGGAVTAPMFAQLVDGAGGKFIAYHMFYGYDPKSDATSIDDSFAHEGDWERLIILLDDDDKPTEYRFEGHGCSSTFFKERNHIPKSEMTVTDVPNTTPGKGQLVDGTHPVLYVSQGSHAAYPFLRGKGDAACTGSGNFDETDYDEATAVTWRPWESNLVVNPQTQCWYGYGGAWGRGGESLSLVGRGDDTGPDGPHWNIAGLPDAKLCPKDGGALLLSSSDSLTYGESATIQIEGYTPGTEVVVSLASVETGMALATIASDGTATISFDIPQGFGHGHHRVIVRAAATGVPLAVDHINVVAPPECLVVDGGQSTPDDIDGDLIKQECDPFPLDGPLADFDGDGVPNMSDNCPRVANPSQGALSRSSVGSACSIRNGHNPAAEMYFEFTGTYPNGPSTPVAPSQPGTAEPIEYEPFDNAPPDPTGAYGFGLNPQPAIPVEPPSPDVSLPASVQALPTDARTQPYEIANTGGESRQLTEVGFTLIGIGLLTLAYVRDRRRQ